MSMEQPDGTQVDVRLYGDELYIRGEGLDGYSVIRDPKTGYICYADLNADSTDWVSTGRIYRGTEGGDSTSALAKAGSGRTKGLDLKPEAKRRIRANISDKLGLAALEAEARAAAASMNASAPSQASHAIGALRKSSAVDSVKRVLGVIVLVDFPDVRATFTKEQISDMGNLKGFNVNGNNGSIHDYFLDVSHGKFDYSLMVTDYYTAKNNKAYYDRPGGYEGGQELIKEALQALAAKGFDFSTLSVSGSGTVRGVNVLFAGAAGKTWGQGIWAHRGNIPTLNFNGVKVSGYMLTDIGTSLTIGTFIHESGHLLFGWPDLYDYDNDSRGLGTYCLMSGQNYKNPQPPNAWLRAGQGWEPLIDLKTVTNGLVSVPSNGRANYKYVNPANAKESFIIENIAKKGRWANLPDFGLMIWHVDEGGNNSWQDETAARHYEVSVTQADDKFDLERNINYGGPNDLYRAGNNAAFTSVTAPNSKWWNGSASGLGIVNISAIKDTMTFQLQGVATSMTAMPAADFGMRISGRALRIKLPGDALLDITAATPDGRDYRLAIGSYAPGEHVLDLSALPRGLCLLSIRENGGKSRTRSLILD